MTQYIDLRTRNGLIRLALAIILAFALPTSAFVDWSSQAAQENGTKGIEQQERHFAVTSARLHPQQHFPAALSRLPYEQTALVSLEPYLLPLLFALFYPLIYNLLKRLLLYPLKFTSNYVVFTFGG
ncbi:hypothetical protein SAMN04487895_103175 [Paenibacillus sophorae]|uniref:Uncharacterized protein n=1 Tax=Paenibacillus sophorae TaxID=1333845 RepID=A0A1H8JXC8_9BACL|nr:hypothetical protein [Paenibacillus sophorae]QWU13506.1 hypothetical protein KP014_16045 [Paenibacillus sophorae]SEN84906.1 hypothetical protein SAMN04487895_103175 [Paenibacillus sophorae]